ncbi:MAG: anti-sigma factor antagonist [Leptolyngbya sp. DLM2.Bin15]|nr:MAG: anti-sigma factor antagonist [Leptolyngbya sp. DLM2.Bin15]
MSVVVSTFQPMVIQPPETLDVSTAPVFQADLMAAIAASSADIWVDMAEVTSLDSAGLMALVTGLTRAQSLNREFYLCNVSSSARIVFELTQLDRIFAFKEESLPAKPLAA